MSLKTVIAKKVILSFSLFIIAVGINFTIIHLAPGDPIIYLLAGETVSLPEGYIDELRSKYGLDKPIWMQFFTYLNNVFRGDFGESFYHGKKVITLVLERLPNTILLTVTAFLFTLVFGVVIGIYCSKKPYSKFDNFFSTLSLIFWALPTFWIGIIFILVFAIYWRILPAQGMIDIGAQGFDAIKGYLRHLILPVMATGLGNMALYLRFTRTSMLEQLNLDYIKTAWAKGCDFNQVFYGHAFKNALLPLVTLVALRMRALFMGSLLVETTFAWPGMGRLLYESIGLRDYGTIQCIFLFYAAITIILNLVADVAYSLVDPRVRVG